jgi:phage terminase small subunit
MTEKQELFVEKMAKGTSRAEAALLAGYSDPGQDSYRLIQLPHIQQAVFQQRACYITTELATTACEAIRELIENKKSPAMVKFLASKWILEVAGHQAVKATSAASNKPLNEMTMGELQDFIQARKRDLDGIRLVDIPPAEPTKPEDIKKLKWDELVEMSKPDETVPESVQTPPKEG